MKVIVGLGNPGRQYARTPHNAGFEVIDLLAQRSACRLRRSWRLGAQMAQSRLGDQQVWLVKPLAFMNNSGPVVAAILRQKGLDCQDLVVIADDADLPVGQLRIRARGGSGGHKGLQSLIDHLGREGFSRIRLGIGRQAPGLDLASHVLAPWSAAARRAMEPMLQRAAQAAESIIALGVDEAMNVYNAPYTENAK